MSSKKTRKLPYQRRKALYGYGFISLWLVGTVIFFLIPLIQSLRYSFCEVKVNPGSLETEFAGLKKYIY
ncbi:MAG: sugar ABC transporter permease, partial [Ruminococcus sp.]|nr:sugar ABC transporter permease [Ruminococcus sp.]